MATLNKYDTEGNLVPALKALAAYNMQDLVNVGNTVYPVQHTHIGTSTNTPSQDKPIQGEMLTVKKFVSLEVWENMPPEVIKREMMQLLVDQMMNNNYIEFTMQKDNLQRDMVRIAARIFVTPDSQVRLLREKGY